MNKSESIANLAKALSAFQGEVSNPANTANNPFYKSKYAPLSEVLNSCRNLLAKHGLSIIQIPSCQGDSNVSITTVLLHSSGESIEFDPLVLKAQKLDPQGAGSAITYGRRYALSAILGISSEDDDDANHASTTDKKEDKAKANTKVAPHAVKEQKVDDNLIPPAAENNGIKWASFWATVKDTFKFNEDQVHAIASEICGTDIHSLKDIIKNQNDLNKLIFELRKRVNLQAVS